MIDKYIPKMGDIVEYAGEEWEVGFINQIEWRGTVRIHRGRTPEGYIAEHKNRIYPEKLKLIKRG